VAELVAEHTEAAVLGLRRVVTDPHTGVAELDSAGEGADGPVTPALLE